MECRDKWKSKTENSEWSHLALMMFDNLKSIFCTRETTLNLGSKSKCWTVEYDKEEENNLRL